VASRRCVGRIPAPRPLGRCSGGSGSWSQSLPTTSRLEPVAGWSSPRRPFSTPGRPPTSHQSDPHQHRTTRCDVRCAFVSISGPGVGRSRSVAPRPPVAPSWRRSVARHGEAEPNDARDRKREKWRVDHIRLLATQAVGDACSGHATNRPYSHIGCGGPVCGECGPARTESGTPLRLCRGR
jgi:hypothetical protein